MALKRAKAKYERAAFNSKWKYEKSVLVASAPQTARNLAISPSCLADYGNEMYKDL